MINHLHSVASPTPPCPSLPGTPLRSGRTLGRRLLGTLLSIAVLAGCKQTEKPETTTTAAAATPAAAKPSDSLTVGFVYVGSRADYGYNQAHAEGAKAVAAMPGVKVREEENVPETVAVQKTMESMINLDGA